MARQALPAVRARRLLLECLRAGLAAVDGAECVRRLLVAEPDWGAPWLVAVGKAASAMSHGAVAALGETFRGGLAVIPAGAGERLPDVMACVEGSHPLPDERSMAAARAVREFLRTLPPGAPVLFLISGGTSSLVELPASGLTLAEVRRAWQWLLGSGLDIGAMNRVRTALSAVKGGGMACWLEGRKGRVIAISDVPGDDPALIGSGPLHSAKTGALPELPDWLQAMLRKSGRQVPPAPPIPTRIAAGLDQAMAAAARVAEEAGEHVAIHEPRLTGEAAAAGRAIAAQLVRGGPGVHIWGGEPPVRLPASPGRGGRCQTLALAAAERLSGRDDVLLLAAATDGMDGNSDDAGALVDGGTLERGSLDGDSALSAIARADAGSFLAAAGDLVHTGPTGTNVTDLVIGWKAQA